MKGVQAETVNLKFAVKNRLDEVQTHSIMCHFPAFGKSVLRFSLIDSDISASCNEAWNF